MSILLESRKIFVPLLLQTDTVRLVQLVEHQIVVLGVVGSSPTSHPKLERERFLMSFSFCFSPMRRAALFALASSFLAAVVFAAGNAFSFLALWYSLQAMLFSFLALWHSVPAMPYHFWLCGTRCRQCLLLFWRCGIRYRRGHPMVRNMRAVLKKASWGTRRIFRGIRCKKQAFPVRKGYSVRRTASCGTRRIRIFGISPLSGTEQDSLNRKRVSLALYANETTWQSSFSAWLSQIPHNSHPLIRRQCDNT